MALEKLMHEHKTGRITLHERIELDDFARKGDGDLDLPSSYFFLSKGDGDKNGAATEV